MSSDCSESEICKFDWMGTSDGCHCKVGFSYDKTIGECVEEIAEDCDLPCHNGKCRKTHFSQECICDQGFVIDDFKMNCITGMDLN